jgi:hypothetical protein
MKKHLGGHSDLTHTDVGILEFLKTNYKIKTMIDIGCGPGGQVSLANSIGICAEGIDGYPGNKREKDINIILHDFSVGKYNHYEKRYDLGWSCEFVEHVEEKYVLNFLNTFKTCKYIFLTFAPPNTHGHHHVNCREESYWINTLESNGFSYDKEATSLIRKKSTMKRDFARKCGLFFINKET